LIKNFQTCPICKERYVLKRSKSDESEWNMVDFNYIDQVEYCDDLNDRFAVALKELYKCGND
jgi:hypothetical protein